MNLTGKRKRFGEMDELPVEDGTVSASELPWDRRMADVACETATFGMG